MRQESQRELYTVGDDNLVREVIDQECTKQLETGANITQLAVSKCEALLYAGLSEPLLPGSIRCYRFNPFSGDYSEFAAHSGEVTQIAVSYDDSQVITAGSDGTLCFFKVTDREVHHLRREKDKPILPYAEELIIGNEEIKDLTNEISTLTTKIEDKQQRDKLKFEMAIQDKQEKIDQLEQQLDENASTDKVRINTIIQTKTKEEAVAHKTMSQLDTDHQKEMETMVQTNEHKIAIEKARFAELKEMKSTSLAEYKGQCVLIEKNHNVLLDKRENDHIRFLNSKRDELVSLVQQKSALQAQFDVRRTELEEGNEIDLQEIRVADRFDLQYENARNLEAKGNLKLMKKKHSNILVKLQQMKEHIKARKNKTVEQEKVIAQIHKEKGFMKKEILDRDVTVRDKDSKISDLRKKNQELEKFKFVLDYKIKELKREILPREKEIQIMSQQTKEMEKELKHLRGVNENLQLMVDDLKMRQEGMKNQVSNHKDELQFSKTKIEGFKTDVFDAIQYIADYKQLKGAILKVYNKHVTTQPTDKELVPDIQKEYGQQRKYLEKNVTNLKEKISKESQTHRTDNMRFVRHNALLLSEINGLRKEYKSLASVKKQIDIVNSQNATFDNSEMEYKRELKEQASEISTLKARLNQFSSPRPPRAKSTGLKRPRIERLDL